MNTRSWYVVLSVSVLVSSVLGAYLGYYSSRSRIAQETSQSRGGIDIWLVVEHYDVEGKLMERRVKKSDSFVKNFASMIQIIFEPASGVSYGLTDIGGTGRGYIKDKSAYSWYYISGTSLVEIGIGSSDAAFGIENYTLGNPIAWNTVSSPTLAILGNQMNVSISTTFSFDASYTISETGVRVYLNQETGYDYWNLILRDLISPSISVNAGDTVTITYIIQING